MASLEVLSLAIIPKAVMESVNCFHSLIRVNFIKVLLAVTFLFVFEHCTAGDSVSDSLKMKRSRIISLSSAGVISAGSYIALSEIWYSDFDKTDFHFFNDLNEWNGMDKLGHVTTAYNLSDYSSRVFRRCGWQEKSALIGSAFGFTYTSALEFLDAYSAEWGFSVYDLGANFLGSSSFYLQDKLNGAQMARWKWSYSDSGLSSINPGLLGSTTSERMLKDYNGQTYWLSIDLFKLNSAQERWISVSLGHSIHDFTRAQRGLISEPFQPSSQWLVSFDVNWDKVPLRNKHLKNVLKVLNFIKLPFPAVQWANGSGITFHPIYF